MPDLTHADWGKIHARAWRDDKFKRLLETDPTAAIKEYGKSVGKTFDKILSIREAPRGFRKEKISDEFLEKVNPFPPWCC